MIFITSVVTKHILPSLNPNQVSVCGVNCNVQSSAIHTNISLNTQIVDFFGQLFNTKDWPARWNCGKWSDFHGWLYITSDLLIWASYFTIPLLLMWLLKKRSDIPFHKVIWLFVGFIILCGTSHLIDAAIFWWPAYRLSALIRFLTSVVSIATVYALFKVVPSVASLRTVEELEHEIKERKLAEEKLAASEFLLKEAGRIGKVGGWDLDLLSKKATWSTAVYDIHEVPHSYNPQLENGLNFYAEPFRAQLEKAIAETIDKGKAYDLKLQIITAKGRKIWIRTSGEALYDNHGKLIKLRGIFADINESMHQELALKESIEIQERLNNALIKQIEHIKQQDQTIEKIREIKFMADSIPQIIWTAKADGNVDYFNQHWFDYTGFTLEETIKWGWTRVIHPDDLEKCTKLWVESIATGKPYEIEYRFKRAADGLYKWHIGRALPMKDKHGDIVKWFGSCTDIDEYKKALELENKIGQYEDFNRILAHNLRGPAGSIEMLILMITETSSEKEREEWLGMLKQSSKALNETLDELMKVLEVRNNKNLTLDNCNLKEVVKKVEAMLQGQIALKNATIETNFGTLYLKFPKIYLESIIYNLISNSLKYSKPNVPPKIVISSSFTNHRTILTFEDNGLGIDLKLHGKNMFKLNKVFHSGFDSKGVGLFMTKIQIETFGGTINVESEPNVGTKFTINYSNEQDILNCIINDELA